MKFVNGIRLLLLTLFIVSLVLSVNAQNDIPVEVTVEAGEQVVLADADIPVLEVEPESDIFSLFSAEVLAGIVTVLITIILMMTLYVLLQAIKQLGLSVPPDIVQSWTTSFQNLADTSMDKLREQSRLTVSPFDDMALAGLEYSLPKVLEFLETMIVSDDELNQLLEAAKKPVASLDASLLEKLE